MNNYKFYCLSYNNEEKKQNMIRIFNLLRIPCIFYEGVSHEDRRIKDLNEGIKKVFSISYGHLDMIRHFYEYSDKEFGIFCENDVFIHKDLVNDLPDILRDMKTLELDVLSLGYLSRFKIYEHYVDYNLKKGHEKIEGGKYKYHNFPDLLWGAQMYILTRNQAKVLLEKYTEEYANRTLIDTSLKPFSADFTMIKEGNRALITPILCIENNHTTCDHESHDEFHKDCFECHYDKDLFIR
jgi:hypothetical protein